MADEHSFGQPRAATPTLDLIARLQAARHARDSRGLYFIEGVRNFVAAVEHHAPIETIVYSERLLTVPVARKLVRQLKRADVPYARLSPEQFRSISRMERASGVGAILRQQFTCLADLALTPPSCWIALRHVRNPGNFGTLLRTATAVGASGFLLLGSDIDPYNPAVIRASMGTWCAQPFVRTRLPELQQWAQARQVHIVGASPDGPVAYTELGYRPPLVLLLGEERAGLTAEERGVCTQLVCIPMAPGADSLNLGVAGSLLLYEVLRASGQPGSLPNS
ncbi:MAG: RNA methyltransferase [Chloroflexaceae bacterium]|jgi:TrmH family RNA methyltransferase|nr:RNA methyltransferase [Chloroflexaceae bacterium]